MLELSNLNRVTSVLNDNVAIKGTMSVQGKKCPRCGNDEIQNQGNYFYCSRCDYEW